MGIEKFFNSLVNNETILKNNILVLQNKISADYVYIDFNSILYKIASQIETDLNKLFFELIHNNNDITNESKEIAKKWKYDVKNFSLDNFKKYFNDNFIDDSFIDLIINDLNYIFSELLIGDHIKKIYISMDGVPNMAKIIEQKKRRYMGYILNESKKDIYVNNKKFLSKERQIYEENKIRFSRNKILGYHEFMKKISQELQNSQVIDNFKNNYKQLQSYIFSGSNNPGEGEKKIMEDILENSHKGKYVIYSPDADVIILSSIMTNKLNNNSEMYVLRFDQQELKYDIVDINILNNNIFNYIELDNQKKMSEINILNDIMFIFTMFGNDFVHKIESIDAKKDFEILLQEYKKFLSDHNSNIIVNENINYENLCKYIEYLANNEKDMLNDTYLIKHYKNYQHLKRQFKEIFWFNTLHRTLINYTLLSNIIFKYIRKWENEFNNSQKYTFWNNNKKRNEINYINVKKYIEKNISFLISELLKHDFQATKDNNISLKIKFNNSNYIRQFTKMFLIIELNVDLEMNDINDNNLYFNFIDIIKKELFKHNGKKIYTSIIPNIKLEKYNYTTKDKYHSNKIIENMVSEKMQVTKYDYETYAFEYMLDKYKYKLNAVDDLIGKCSLNYLNNQYVYTYDIIEKYHDRYYKIYFGNNYDLYDISEKYFEGICWVFDFYFKKNDSEFNYNNVSTWFYQYHRSPMLIDLKNYLKKQEENKLLNIHKKVINLLTDRQNFMNPMEHYLYVTPKNSINIKNNKILWDIINNNPQVFPDLDLIINKIMNDDIGNENSVPIDCRRVSYLSKCTLKSVKDISFREFMSITKKLREEENNMKYSDKPFKKVWNDQKGGHKLNDLLIEIKTNYKIKYIESGNIEFKKMYKMTKKILDNF